MLVVSVRIQKNCCGGDCGKCLPAPGLHILQEGVEARYKKASRHGHGTGLLKTDCPKGQFYDIGKKYCYSCPKHYGRTASSVSSSKACSRRISASNHKASYNSKALCPKGSFFDLTRGGSCWSCPSNFDRSLSAVTAPNACAKPLTAQAIDALKGATVYCEKGLIEFHNKCVKKGACGAKGQRPCLLTERLPSCNKGLAEDFSTQKCNPPKSAAQVCEDVLTALRNNKPIPVLERLKREKDRLIKQASDKSGLTKIENSLKKNLSHAFKIKKFEPFRREVDDLMKQVKAKVDDIKKEMLAPHPFCFDSGAQRLAKLEKMKLMPNFGFKKKAGLFDGLLISKAHAAVPAAHYWGLALTGSKSTGAKRGAITDETVFRKDMKTGKNKVLSVIVQPSYPLGFDADPLSFSLGYTYYGQEKRTGPKGSRLTEADFQGLAIPSLGWGV